jgi:hypothetical protein
MSGFSMIFGTPGESLLRASLEKPPPQTPVYTMRAALSPQLAGAAPMGHLLRSGASDFQSSRAPAGLYVFPTYPIEEISRTTSAEKFLSIR